MDVTVTIEGRMARTPDGAVWTGRPFNYSFWARYLDVFDRVNVVIRLQSVPRVPEDWQRADGEGVSFRALPYYHGPLQYVLKARQVRHTMQEALKEEEAVILRVPGISGTVASNYLVTVGHPYGAEVVGDPYDVFAPDVVRHPLRRLFRARLPRDLRRLVAKADAVSYVTAEALQRRYPPSPKAFSTHYSSVTLPDDAFIAAPRTVDGNQQSFVAIFVGSLAQLYKAPDVLLDAVSQCVREGVDLKLLMAGDGIYRAQLEVQAAELGIQERVHFLRQVPPGEPVRAQFDQADLFVLPSKTEGLPRAMIEAMARGLPCIGTTVGGIPELLPPEDMVPPGDSAALASKISQVLRDPERRARMAARNLANAQEYHRTILQERRNAFYRATREVTESWLKTRAGAQQVGHTPRR
jgi:glycosyltransferase involved in cell wall biosynthesis